MGGRRTGTQWRGARWEGEAAATAATAAKAASGRGHAGRPLYRPSLPAKGRQRYRQRSAAADWLRKVQTERERMGVKSPSAQHPNGFHDLRWSGHGGHHDRVIQGERRRCQPVSGCDWPPSASTPAFAYPSASASLATRPERGACTCSSNAVQPGDGGTMCPMSSATVQCPVGFSFLFFLCLGCPATQPLPRALAPASHP